MANGKRLVYAEAIARKLKNTYCAECHVVRKVQCSACWVEDVLELLEDEAVEAVEVVHGEWNTIEDDYVGMTALECSVCNQEYWFEDEPPIKIYNYCPNCGAKMDGDGDA